jgi:putative ABC transport system substrate-binding protein
MQRREFIALLGGAALAAPRLAMAQSAKVYRVATLAPGGPITEKSPFGTMLLQGLEQRGYTLGKNLAFDSRAAMGEVGKLPELVRSLKADVPT